MKKFRLSGFDLRTLFLFSFLALAACSTGMDTDEDGEVEDGETPAETAETTPTDAVPEEVAEVEAPPPEAPAAQESPPASVEQQPVAQAAESAPAQVAEPVEATPPAAADPAAVAAVEPAPAPVSEPVSQPAPSEGTSYTVKAGDTLMRISWEQYGTLFRWREIYQVNKARIADPNHVPPGTLLELPAEGRNPAAAAEHNGEQYLIVKGDTLGRISNKVYGTLAKWKMIWENNRQLIRDPNKIYAGFYLYYVPEAKMTSTEESAAADAEPTG
jgi:nucleoid-associated protein YgaU